MTMQNFSVLIADDNELNRWLLSEQLGQWTSNITSATNGREALQLVQTRKYSLIFLDLNMPFLNGLDLIEKIRSAQTLNGSTPAIAITAYTDREKHQALTSAGFNDCLVKPVLLEHLRPLMERVIPSTEITPQYYAAQIIKKTELNRDLSLKLLNKLFEEVPNSLACIDQAIQESDHQQAWQMAHKLHGTFCFCGFADFLPMAAELEQCLLNKESSKANTNLQAIQERFARLLHYKAAILEHVEAEVAKDSSNPS